MLTSCAQNPHASPSVNKKSLLTRWFIQVKDTNLSIVPFVWQISKILTRIMLKLALALAFCLLKLT